MGRPYFWTALVFLGCATTPGPDENEGSMDIVRTTIAPQQTIDLTRANTLYASEYGATRDEVLRVLIALGEDIGIPLSGVDPKTGTVVHLIQAYTPRIAGKPASAWVDCGRGAGGTPRASTYRITISLTSVAESVADNRTRVRVMLVGTARDRAMSADELQCATTGQLEKHVLAVVSARLNS